MSVAQRLAEVFDRGHRQGVDSLSPSDRELYLIQHFILDYEMSGLSGLFYNRLPDLSSLRETSSAMRSRGAPQLADLVDEILELFQGYLEPQSPTVWDVVLNQNDPTGKLDSISRRIDELPGYGLNELDVSVVKGDRC